MKKAGVILAGGKSSRMGENKALLPIGERPAISLIAEELQKSFPETIIIANQPEVFEFLGLPIFMDRYQEAGPLAGLEAAFSYDDSSMLSLTGCDMPFISHEVYDYLANQMDEYEAVIPIFKNRIQPLSGIYHRKSLEKLRACLDGKQYKVKQFLDQLKVNYLELDGQIPEAILSRHFFNMNYREEYEQIENFM
ncbi:molybdenum cofactor guanylyltransferase [Sediminibacillus massiliensis]|uniref:molybdenum cofactor guanylyltransferase n=1 Tax=Sediminibacillus massiliensis TaxID=1926277 RepID=UPI0009885ECD|nr:molybdenum cofactor guanylyltransferase [Sediminibacillus massiliensis]